MKKLTTTGDGLSVLIVCDYVPIYNWMTFATWYSLSKILPDARVGIMCNRRPITWQMFDWTRTLKVKMRQHPPVEKEEQVKMALADPFYSTPLLVVEPDVLAIRDVEADTLEYFQKPFVKADKVWVINDFGAVPESADLCSDVREDKISTFVSYPAGWGNFVASTWINKASSPFRHKFGKAGMTANEIKVEKLWQQLATVFQTVSRG